MSTSEQLLVRLKAHEPKRGHVLRVYSYGGMKFDEAHGWYRVPRAVAEYLRGVHQTIDDETSPLAFDVCTDAEAMALDKREVDEKERRTALRATTAEPRARVADRERTGDRERREEREPKRDEPRRDTAPKVDAPKTESRAEKADSKKEDPKKD